MKVMFTKNSSLFLPTFFLLLTATLTGHAQRENSDWKLYKTSKISAEEQQVQKEVMNPVDSTLPVAPGTLQVHYENKKIENLVREYQLNPTPFEGFRIQLFFGDREEANQVRSAFLKSFPKVPSYLTYLAPNFRVRVGDFRTRLEAERFLNTIGDAFPNSYIVEDLIELQKEAKNNH